MEGLHLGFQALGWTSQSFKGCIYRGLWGIRQHRHFLDRWPLCPPYLLETLGLRSSISDTMLCEQSHFLLSMTLPDSLTRQTFVPERKKKKKENTREMRSQARRKRRWSWSYLYMAWSPAWSRDIAVEQLYPVTLHPQRVSDSRFPDSWRISYGWNINNNYRSVPWAVLSPCTYFLSSKHMTMFCWHIGMTYCQWCHALEVESRRNIRSYCIFMGRGERVFFFFLTVIPYYSVHDC